MTATDLTYGEQPQITAGQKLLVQEYLDASLAPGTRASYASSWRGWEAWCTLNGHAPLPAHPLAIAAYLTELAAGGKAASTIARASAAIASQHTASGVDDPTKQRGVVTAMKGIRRRKAGAPTKKAHALSTAEVRRIVTAIGDRDTSLRSARDAAIILLAYSTAMRRGELSKLLVGDVRFKPRGLVVTIRVSKGDQEGGGQMVGVVRGQHPETDPVSALRRWIELAGIAAGEPLFQPIAYSDRRVLHRPLSGQSIAAVMTTRASDAGLGDLHVTGHSTRAGHATQAAENGVPAARIMRTTRHARFETFAGYVRPAEVLADTSSADLGL
jgi:integrase